MPATEDPQTPDPRLDADPEAEDFLVRLPV